MELSWTSITSRTATGKRRTRKTTLPVKSSASSTRATLATTSSSRPRSAQSSIKAAHFRRQHYPPRGLARYGDRSITKWDIFHYIYAVLHHPEYRQRYSANLRRELPRFRSSARPQGLKPSWKGRPTRRCSAAPPP